MNSFIRQKVVKSYAIEVAGPCLVDCQFEEFQMLTKHLTILAPTESPPSPPASWQRAGAGEVGSGGESGESGEERYENEVWIAGRAEGLLEKAGEEAEGILAEARLEAERIRQGAQEEAARARATLEAALRAEVMPLAQEEGFRAGFAQGEAKVQARQQEAERLLRLAEASVRSEYARVDETLLQLALKMAERIVRGVLGIEPQRLLDIARSLVLLPQEREHSVLHVAAEDGVWLSSLEQELVPCPWQVDDTLRPGECFLECEEGIFDARLEVQLEKLEKALREELQHGRLEPDGPES